MERIMNEDNKRHAFVCTVPSTIIEAVNFIVTNSIKHADMYIVNVTQKSQQFAERARETGICENVYFVENVLLTYPITIKKCIECVLNGKKLVKEIKARKYDYCYYNNSGWLVNSIFYTGFYSGNHDVKNRFIEHVCYSNSVDYSDKSFFLRLAIMLMGYKVMDGSMLEALYVFDKNLVTARHDGELREMKRLDKNNHVLVDTLNKIFDYKSDDAMLNKRVVILEQGKLKVDYDLSIWNTIIDGVNKESTVIKTHPRQKVSYFKDSGIELYGNSSAPWEVEILNCKGELPVHISLFSTSCISPKYYLNEEPEVIYLFDLCDKKPEELLTHGDRIADFMKSVCNTYSDKTKVHIPKNIDELKSILEETEY